MSELEAVFFSMTPKFNIFWLCSLDWFLDRPKLRQSRIYFVFLSFFELKFLWSYRLHFSWKSPNENFSSIIGCFVKIIAVFLISHFCASLTENIAVLLRLLLFENRAVIRGVTVSCFFFCVFGSFVWTPFCVQEVLEETFLGASLHLWTLGIFNMMFSENKLVHSCGNEQKLKFGAIA